jgi:hypothetical protein
MNIYSFKLFKNGSADNRSTSEMALVEKSATTRMFADSISDQDVRNAKYDSFYKIGRMFKKAVGQLAFIIICFLLTFASCRGDGGDVVNPGLPWGVFPLDKVRWEYSSISGDGYLGYPIYDDTGKVIAFIEYRNHYRDETYYINKINDNTAELYRSVRGTIKTYAVWTDSGERYLLSDSSYIIEPYLYSLITVEGKKVFEQYQTDNNTAPKRIKYDFNLQLNDTLYIPSVAYPDEPLYQEKHILYWIDSVKVGNEYRKRCYLERWGRQERYCVVEGVGSTDGLKRMYYENKLIWGNPSYDKKLFAKGGNDE